MLKTFLCFSLIFLPLFARAEYKPPLKWSGNIYKIIHNHNEIHKKFSAFACRPGDEQRYNELLKDYRGQGFYLPKLEGVIDRKAILKNMDALRGKVNFIEALYQKLKKDKKLPSHKTLFNEINEIVKNLLNLKKQNFQALQPERRKKILFESNRELIRLKKQFDILVDKLYFMKSYRYPNDFLSLRAEYESVKDLDGPENKHKANTIFFYRKVIEDGALHPDRTRPDKYIRSTLDTLRIQLNKEENFISENARYDLNWVEKNLERFLRYGYQVQLARLKEWKERAEENFRFYNEIIRKENKNKAQFLIKKENEATAKLKDYVYKKQAEVYEFWAKQPVINKALYSLETILINEVGVLDGAFGLERTAVAKVVLNRYHDDFYNQLEDDQPIVDFIDEKIDTEEELWLNVLFKVGEFSFTYHYIPAVAKIFCPDMSGRGNSIRKKNLKFALKALRTHEGHFKAMRYFSRVSMFGKIDMSTVWEDYARLPEMVGYKVAKQRRLIYQFHANNYQYLYSFKDRDGLEFTVIRINDVTYSMRWKKGNPIFYDYRNPHLFTYFVKNDL